MATPLGHSLLGLGLSRLPGAHRVVGQPWRWYAFAILAANAPDLDLLPGLLVGDINRFHQGPSHSLLAALVFALLVAVATGRSVGRLRLATGSTLLYVSHLVLDFLTRDGRAPYGQPLLWPLTDAHFISPWTPFGGVLHADPGDPVSLFLSQLFSWHNARVALLEILVMAPIVLATWRFTKGEPFGGATGAH